MPSATKYFQRKNRNDCCKTRGRLFVIGVVCSYFMAITTLSQSHRVGQVKTLKPLSTLKLQQLCSLMEEESFVDEQYIATEGEMGDKFYIAVHGNVRLANGTCIAECAM